VRIVSCDFETYPIPDNRADYPPAPVGLAYKYEGRPAEYLAFGHETENNCDERHARMVLRDIFDSARNREVELVFHNAKFDLSVAYQRWELEELPWQAVHDTTFLAYLCDPHDKKIDLKYLAEEWLDVPPDERDELVKWVGDNTKAILKKYPEHREWDEKKGRYLNPGRIAKTKAGRWIFAAPGDLVGRYAKGDVERTLELFHHLRPIVKEHKMLQPYNRERRLLPILMENERDGMRVDTELLREDVEYYGEVLEYVEDWMRQRLRASGLSFDDDRTLAQLLDERGIVDPKDWEFTDTGEKWRRDHPDVPPEEVPAKYRSVAKDKLTPDKFKDQKLAQALGYRNRLVTCLKMFMRPWLRMADQTGGYISTNWNQVASERGGTRTGRPSTSSPNFLNLSKSFEDRTDGYVHPDFLDVEPLPLVRRYIVPDEGHVFLHRDFSGQEVRVFAHFEQGDLLDAYIENPALDPHGWLKEIIYDLTGVERERTKVKNVTFLRLYGGGKFSVIAQLRVSEDEAKQLLASHDKALPGRKLVVEEIQKLARKGKPIRTWGGRLYFEEPRKKIDGKWKSFDYKLINYLVQGSASDITKECLIRWYNHPDRDPRTRFLVTVYDEINITCPEDCWEEQMAVLRECMDDIELDCPMLSEGAVGPNWADLEDCE
jgi:DNA polymerase-1